MSRSYRKQPVAKDHKRAGSAKSWKKIANRKFRRNNKEFSSKQREVYKKITRMTYDIHDYKWLESEEQARASYQKNIKQREQEARDWKVRHSFMDAFETEEEFIIWWRKQYRNK